MNRTPTILVSVAVFISLAVVFLLYIGADKKMNYQYASFERNFKTPAIVLVDTFNLKYYNYYFAGNTAHTIYLANSKVPAHLISVSTALADSAHYELRVDNDSLQYRAIRIAVDSPYFYMSDGSRPFIYRGGLSTRTATAYIDNFYFKTTLPISKQSMAFVALIKMETTLGKKTNTNSSPAFFPDLLEEQGDGIFSTDGMFLYDRGITRLVYVYYYRNQYICMDTSLNLLYRANTIDTINQAKIKTSEIRSEKSFTMSAPPLITNKKSAVGGGYLFINSNLLAGNEKASVFEEQAVIDVYSLDKKSYQFSFYLPRYKGKKATEFIVIDGTLLIALHEPYLVTYKLSSPTGYESTIAQ